MQRILIVDHCMDVDQNGDPAGTRHQRIKDCLLQLGAEVVSVPQIYGGPSLTTAPAGFDESLLNRSRATVSNNYLILLHCGQGQHLVPAVLADKIAHDLPCLLYTASLKPREPVQRYLKSESASPKHVVLPAELRLSPQLTEDWPQSREGSALRECVKAILSGTAPSDAVYQAFGNPKLEAALDELYKMLADGKTLKDISDRRDELLPHDPWGEPC
jgi:hypothetical protein